MIFEKIALPIPGLSEAPITAIEFGLKKVFFESNGDVDVDGDNDEDEYVIIIVSQIHGYIYSCYDLLKYIHNSKITLVLICTFFEKLNYSSFTNLKYWQIR